MEIVCPAWHPSAQRLIDELPLLADQGVTAIEIGYNSPDYFDSSNAFEIQNLVNQLSACGIRVHSIHAPFGPAYDISSLDDSEHERGVDALIDAIALASMLGAEKVVVHGSDAVSDSRSRHMDRAHGVLRELSVVAKESGVVLALENLPPDYIGHTADEIKLLLNGIDEDSIGVCFDSGHANLSGHFAELAESLLPLAITTHLHDNDGITDLHQFPGSGIIDWHNFFDIYRRSASIASIMLECRPPDGVCWSEAFQRFRIALGD